MGFGYATVPVLFVRSRAEYACVGAPPEKEVAPEPRRNGAVVAGLARVLRGVLGAPVESAHGGPYPLWNAGRERAGDSSVS